MLVCALTAFILITAGCGSNGGTTAGSSTTDTTATTASTTTSTTTEPISTTTTTTTTTVVEGKVVQVYFSGGDGSDCSAVEPFDRTVASSGDVIAATLDELVAGPTDEEMATGVGSFFSADTSDVVTSVMVNDGLLLIDFEDLRPLIPNASTSCGSMALLSQLNATLLQFPEVDSIIYQIDGSCALFANWLQTECFSVGRDGEQNYDVPINEQASGSGCTPPAGDGLPAGRWFGYVVDAQSDQVEFDLACWFNGTAAALAAAEDGEESPPPNDYYVRNENDVTRTLTVDEAAEVSWLPTPGDPATQTTISYSEFLESRSDRPFQPGVWLTVGDQKIVVIEEQYVP